MILPTSDSHLKGNDEFLRRVSMNFNIDRDRGFLAANSTDSSVRKIQDRMDDLDVRIALRDFEDAVRSIEKGISLLALVHINRAANACVHGFQTGDVFPPVSSPVPSN